MTTDEANKMTLTEAIEIVEKAVEATSFVPDHPLRHAQKLLIEAGKYILYRDNCPGINTRLLLPGETEE